MSIEERYFDQARRIIQDGGLEKMTEKQILDFVDGLLQNSALPNAGKVLSQEAELSPMAKFLQKLKKENPSFPLKSQGNNLVEEYLNALLAKAKEQGEDASVVEDLETVISEVSL